jgi:hypothetical protein
MAHKEAEPEDLLGRVEPKTPGRVTLVVFEGEKDHFLRLAGWHHFLREELRAITRAKWLAKVHQMPDFPVALHIRRGDFKDARTPEDFVTKGALRTPARWFVECLKMIRKVAGFPVRAFVFSDARDHELAEVLDQENVFHVSTGSAIGDLLALSRARVLIGSGGSSFSAWASFLGQMPTVSYPGQSLGWFKLRNSNGFYVGELDPDSPSQEFLTQVKDILTQRP